MGRQRTRPTGRRKDTDPLMTQPVAAEESPAPTWEARLSQETDDTRKQRLAQMRRVALGLLVLMGAVFVVASSQLEYYPWLGYVRAFAEAAMVGALADWFAVTALFRHPLGLPIPHTNIIQTRQEEIGAGLADFINLSSG